MILGGEGRAFSRLFSRENARCEHAVWNAKKKWMLEGREEKTPKCAK